VKIVSEKASDHFPLTQRQTLMWLDRQLFPSVPYHNVAHTVRLRGPIDLARFEQAYRKTVEEIDSLRLQIDGVTPRQRILGYSEEAAMLELVDLRACPETASDWLAGRIAKPFDFSRPPVSAGLLRLGEADSLFYLGQHHIVTDGMSVLAIIDHLADLYSGRPTSTRPSFRSYAEFERSYRASPRGVAASKFWERKLAGGVPPLRYYGRVRRRETSIGIERVFLDCGPERTRRFAELAASPGIRLLGGEFSRLVAISTAVLAFVHRVTGNRELVLGTPVANRSHALGTTCGLLMEQLFLKVEIDGQETFASLAAKVRSDLAASLRHAQHCVSDRGLDFLALNTLSKRTQTDFAGVSGEIEFREAWAFDAIPPDITGDSRNTFLVQLHDLGADRGLVMGFDFHKSTFEPPLRKVAQAHFLKLFDAFLSDVDTAIGSVDLLDTESRAPLLLLGEGPRPEPPVPDLVEVIAAEASRRPEKLAVRAGDVRLTYRELDDRSSRLASHLLQLGVEPGERVAICLPRGTDEIVTMLATLKAGATYVPIDAGHPADRIQMVLEDALPKILVTRRSLTSILGRGSGSPPALLLLDEAWPAVHAAAAERPPRDATDRLAYILFTSGSTGRPKGVEVGRLALSNFLRSMARSPGLSDDDRLLAITTTTFDISGLELWLPLYVGAEVEIVDRETAQDPRLLRKRLEQAAPTVLQATPATWRLLIEAGWQGGRPLKMLCGGEALSAALATELLARGTELWNMYGPTETTIWSTLKRIEPGFEAITVGRPIDNTLVHVVDDSLAPVPAGIVGEIVIGGTGLARGYHGRPDLTADKFVKGMKGAPERLFYRTGDLGRVLDSGEIECLGRADHQVKIRGFRVELGEIESALRTVSTVREVLVVARVDRPGDPRLTAYWVGAAQRSELQTRARERLPSYMQPSGYVKLDAFPLNTNGKIDRKALPAPSSDDDLSRQLLLPRSDKEVRLAAVWREVLGLAQVSVDQDFFDLGGTSVLAIELAARIEAELGVAIPLAAIFHSPTVEGLLSVIEKDPGSLSLDTPVVVDLRRGAAGVPPLFCLLGVHLYQELAAALPADRPVIGMHLPFRHLPGSSDRPSIVKMGAGYVRLIQKRQPRGPYHLAGLCFGGVIAYEAARQLEEKGERVELITLFDSRLPTRESRGERLSEMVRTVVRQPELLPGLMRQRLGKMAAKWDSRRASRVERPAGPAQPVDVDVDSPDTAADVDRFAAQITGTGARLLVVRALDPGRRSWTAHLGWAGLSPHFVARNVRATHLGLLREPQVRAVAQAIVQMLDAGRGPSEERTAVELRVP